MSNLVSTLKIRLLDDVSKPAATVGQALAKAEKEFKAVGKAMAGSGASDRLTANLAKMGLAAKDVEKVASAWRDYAKSAGLAAKSSDWTKTQTSAVKAWEGQTISALRNVKRERAAFAAAEKSAIEKAIRNEGAGVSSRGGGHGGIGGFIGRHAFGALAAGYTMEKIYEAPAHLAHERVRQAASGMSSNEILDAASQAAKIASEFPSLKIADVNHMLRNARSIVGSYKEAAEIVEPMAKLRVVAQGARPGADVSEDFDQLVKGLEIKGVTQNPKQFHDYMEGIAKGLNVFGDTLKPYQYYEMFKYGRQATSGLSSNFILGTAPTLAQELGGSSYGNAVSGFNRAIVGGRMEHSALKEMYRLGLTGKGDLDFLKNGEVKGLKAGHAIKGWDVAQADPNKWVREFFLPALLKAGISSQSEIQKEVSTVFSNKVAAQMVSILATQQGRIDKDLALLRGAPGLSAADKYLRNDPTIAMMSLKNSIEGLNATLGVGTLTALAPTIADVANAISGYTARLAAMQEYRAKNPDGPTAGQKIFNRAANKLLYGVDSDKSNGEFTLSERNDIAYTKMRKRLLGMRDEVDKTAPEPSAERSARYPAWARGSMTDDDEARRYPYRRYATKQLAEIDRAHQARLKAEKKITDFRRNLPRDMSKHGEGSDHIGVGGAAAFGFPTLGPKGRLKGSTFGFGGYGTDGLPILPGAMPSAPLPRAPSAGPFGNLSGARAEIERTKAAFDELNGTVSPHITIDGIEGATAALNKVLGQLSALRAGVDVPIRMDVKGGMPAPPSIGALNRGSFQSSGDPGR